MAAVEVFYAPTSSAHQNEDARLYVGGGAALAQLSDLGVTRLVSVGWPPAPASLPAEACLLLELCDEESADLLSVLPLALSFWKAAVAERRSVLVACHAGVSRSAAIIVRCTSRQCSLRRLTTAAPGGRRGF
jgi:protein-tyrosine phosphatase